MQGDKLYKTLKTAMKHVQNGKHITQYYDMIHSKTKYIWFVKNVNSYSFKHFKNIRLHFFLQIDDEHVNFENI